MGRVVADAPADAAVARPADGLADRAQAFVRRTGTWWTAAGIYAMSRLVVLLTAQAVTWARPDFSVTQLLTAWDGGWYLRIATDGYPDHVLPETGSIGNRWAFYPGLPAITRSMEEISGFSSAISGIVVATVAGLVAAVAIWLLVEERLGREAALTTTALVCFFPSAYVLGMVYTESLFLLAAALALRTISRRQWIAAGLLACAACVVRSTGVVLVATVVVAAALVVYRDREWRAVIGIALAPLGLIGWTIVQWVAVGTPTASVDAQELWYQKFVWFQTPFKSLGHVLTERGAWSDAQDVMAAGALAFVAASVILAIRYRARAWGIVPVEWWVYSAGVILFAFSPYWPTSILRYVLLAFPLYAVAWQSVPRWLAIAGVGLCGAAMSTLAFGAFLGAITWQTAPYAP